MQLKDGLERFVNRGEFDRYLGNTTEGIDSIHHLQYDVNEVDNMIHVNAFETGSNIDPSKNKIHDLRNGSMPFQPIPKKTGRLPRMNMRFI